MSTKNDYTAEEWKLISSAPMLAGLFVSVSDISGPIGTAKEALAVAKAIGESASGAPEVVTSIAESMRAAGGRPELPDIARGDRTQMKNAIIERLKSAAATIGSKAPTEVEPFKGWLVSVATRVSQASKEGGFLGIGGTLVSPEEQTALKEMAGALGVPAPADQAT